MNCRTSISAALLLALTIANQADADEVINGNLSVQGALCTGASCEVNEDFTDSFDTIRIKDDDPAIHFQDTSSSSSFPTDDWLMGVRDGTTPQTSEFFVEDTNGGDDVLRIGSGADGGVAIGFGSTLEAGAISVGAQGSERRVVHVAQGTDSTDAVNLGQLQSFQSTSEAQFAGEISGLDTDLDALDVRMDSIESRLSDALNLLNNL